MAADKDRLGIEAFWLQLGVRSDRAAAVIAETGMRLVMNRCIKIEHDRLFGLNG